MNQQLAHDTGAGSATTILSSSRLRDYWPMITMAALAVLSGGCCGNVDVWTGLAILTSDCESDSKCLRQRPGRGRHGEL